MLPIIMIWYIRNFQIICDRFRLPIFNNSNLIIVILLVRGIAVVCLKIIVLIVNVWSISIVTFNFNLVFFVHICYLSYDRSIYTCNESYTMRFILLVLLILFHFPTRSRTWCWWFLWRDLYPTAIALLIAFFNKNVLEFYGCALTVGGYSCRGIPSETMVLSHFKTKVWILALGRGTFTTCPYISVFSKTDATSPLTISPLSIQKRDCSAIKLW